MKNKSQPDKQERPSLLISNSDAREKLSERLNKGKEIKQIEIRNGSEFEEAKKQYKKWTEFNFELLKSIFSNDLIAKEYSFATGSLEVVPDPIWGNPLPIQYRNHQKSLDAKLVKLESIMERLELFQTLSNEGTNQTSADISKINNCIFIGHGHSNIWKELKDFLQDRLNLGWDEFNRESTAGISTTDRLQEMVDHSNFAFIIMTAEDEHKDGNLHAREIVIHESGLFQGKLGFRKAIILLEEGCSEFSNINGLGQIRFPNGSLESKFEEIRRVLEREKII